MLPCKLRDTRHEHAQAHVSPELKHYLLQILTATGIISASEDGDSHIVELIKELVRSYIR